MEISMQHADYDRSDTARPISVKVDGEPKGVLVAHNRGFRFLAVKLDAFGVDGQVFETVKAAEAAVRSSVIDN